MTASTAGPGTTRTTVIGRRQRSGDHGRRLAAAITVLALVTIACGSSVTPSASGSGAGTSSAAPGLSLGPQPSPWQPRTSWERRLAAIQPDGTFTKDDALALFATAYGPLPGVDAKPDGNRIADGTLAIRAVAAVRAQLTRNQRDAIDRALAVPANATTIEVAPVSAAVGHVELAAWSTSEKAYVQQEADADRAGIAIRLGQDFRGPLDVVFMTSGADLDGDAWSDFPGGVFGGCRIRLYPPAQLELEVTIAHEVFHCFQLDAYRTAAALSAAPDWLIEGGAEWAAVDLTGGASPWWADYILSQAPLPKETYDAVGFFGHMAEVGLDPWTAFPHMWTAGNDPVSIMQAGGADRDQFVDSWASAVLRHRELGGAWWTAADGHTTVGNYPQAFDVADGSKVDLSMPYLQNRIRVLVVGSDMIHFTTEGNVRINDGHVDLTDVSDSWFCVGVRPCELKCPNGEQPPPIAGKLNPTILVASSGGIDGTIGTAVGKDVDDSDLPCSGGSAPPTEEPATGAFCQQYRDLLIWWKRNPVTEPNKQWSREIVTRSVAMYHVAPPEMRPWAAIVARTYAIYTDLNIYADIPASGPSAAQLPQAGMAMDAYCGVQRDIQGWIKE